MNIAGYEIEYGPPDRRLTMLVQERSRAERHVTHLEGATMHALVRLDDVAEAVMLKPVDPDGGADDAAGHAMRRRYVTR